jgi:DNA modification methylase
MSLPVPYYQDEAVTIYHADCRSILPLLEPKSIDLVLTSPPYDNLREYGGFGFDEFDFHAISRGLYYIVADGGVIVWVVGDATSDGSETGTSFKQALRFMRLGFKLHDTMIYWKNAFAFPQSNRYAQVFEFMFVLSKGAPKTANIARVATNRENRIKTKSSCYRTADGSTQPMKYETGKDERGRENIWIYEVGYQKSAKDDYVFKHPAIFPEALAKDHILSWSNPNDLILDPFLGSGTTALAAKILGRKCIGIEIEEKYCEIAAKRCCQSVMKLEEAK